VSAGVSPSSMSARIAGDPGIIDSHADGVLLVESDDLTRHVLKWLLASDRRECVAVGSAEEAQQLLATHEPALVVTDLNLSGREKGIDLLVWMSRSPRLRDVPMLLMTGDNSHEIRALLTAAGLDHVEVLPKPFERTELKERLVRLMAG
jgi:CheY-like chemotaxis protein